MEIKTQRFKKKDQKPREKYLRKHMIDDIFKLSVFKVTNWVMSWKKVVNSVFSVDTLQKNLKSHLHMRKYSNIQAIFLCQPEQST